jgi:hypothetical protein
MRRGSAKIPRSYLNAPSATMERKCDHPGCAGAGEFRAPRSREELNRYFWFCLAHVRSYNAAWDFHAGMSEADIEAWIRRDTTWHRPTWPLGLGRGDELRLHLEMAGDPLNFFDNAKAERAEQTRRRHDNSPVGQAMRLFELESPLTLEVLRARYKTLVKIHHPDANGGDKASEERFKDINQAYETLLASLEQG